jgi:lysophospholipase L1-like esterase
MELNGKKIAFLGDSITEGCGTSSREYIYWNVVAQRTGAECYGYGIGGTRIAPQRVPTVERPWEDKYFASRVEEMIPDADVVVVFGGTNDFGHGDAAFGELTDRSEDTFCGAYHLLLQKIIARYTDAKVVVMTPMHRLSEDEAYYNEFGVRRAGRLIRYVDAIKEIAGFYGVAVVDLYRDCQIQPRMDVMRQKFMPDGLHPNDAGNAMVADCLLSVLKTL